MDSQSDEMMNYRTDSYLEFLRYCLDDTQEVPECAKGIDWIKMMAWAEKQAIIGVIYGGIQRAGKALDIPFDVLMEWIGYASQIEFQNKLVNKRCVEVVEEFRKDGFECCILKGQGNAMMYPNPLLRNPGDIDLLLSGPIREIIRYVRGKHPNGRTVYHHIDYGLYKDIEVEVHYRPSFLNNLIANRRLQRWFDGRTESTEITEMPDGAGKMTVPSWEFNVVFQLSHIYRHVIQSGLGLRQVVDFYYLLKANKESEEVRGSYRSAQGVKGQYHETLSKLGLMEIGGAVMWVLKEVLGLEEKYLIVHLDERRGRFLLSEIMEGGNFGQYDGRVSHDQGILSKNIRRLKRDIRLVNYFPSECIWEPVFRLCHFAWRVRHHEFA